MSVVALPLASSKLHSRAAARPVDAPAPLRLWHLASLDAPTVAAVWGLAFAWAAHIALPRWIPALLALGTFVAGVHIVAWQFCLLGLIMAICVPAIAWLEESTLILLLGLLALLGIGILGWWLTRRWSGGGA